MNEWIGVSDKLPKENERVLSYCPSDNEKFLIEYVIYSFEGPFWAHRSYRVTHWMELPQPPKE